MQHRTLITGARGFLGSRIVRVLESRGSRVIGLDAAPPARSGDLQVDITSPGWTLPPGRYHQVFHFAGLAHRGARTAAQRELFFAVNREGTRHLLEALDRLDEPPAEMVLASTVAVYGRDTGTLLDEDTPRQPHTPYGQSKAEAEDLVLEWADRRGVTATVLRLPLVLGPGAPGNLARLRRAIRQGWYVGIGSGQVRRSIVLAEDVAAALPTVASCGGTYHLTDGEHPRVRELEEAIAAALNRRPPLRVPLSAIRRVGRLGDRVGVLLHRPMPISSETIEKLTSTLTFSDDRARREFGWSPTPVLHRVSEFARNEVWEKGS